MTCGYAASEFRPYASRGRWIRTANDSYFTAMTYPEGLPSVLQPSDLHDAIWGVFAAVYGGAVHPTAEGHAAMADAALRRWASPRRTRSCAASRCRRCQICLLRGCRRRGGSELVRRAGPPALYQRCYARLVIPGLDPSIHRKKHLNQNGWIAGS